MNKRSLAIQGWLGCLVCIFENGDSEEYKTKTNFRSEYLHTVTNDCPLLKYL